MHRSVASLLWVLALMSVVASALSAQPPVSPGAREIVMSAYTFRYQRASEAMTVVYPLLSRKGTVELQPSGNTLVIRDTPDAVRKIMPVLRGFDHPTRPLRLEVYIVRASRTTVSPQVQHSDLPEDLTRRLRSLLGYDVFETQAQAQLSGVEGQSALYELGPEYKVSFRFGTLMDGQRVKLSGFRISRHAEGRPESNLLQTNLMLSLDQTMSLGFAKSESSPDALMVVLTLREGESSRR
ncbi:MAG TPA: secretin N-terminal domain-containing protein [Thermoanaerobaculia bacterium]